MADCEAEATAPTAVLREAVAWIELRRLEAEDEVAEAAADEETKEEE